MKKSCLMFAFGLILMLVSADVKNEDKPLKGQWDFRLQKVWEVDCADGMPFERPSELRASQDEVLFFHDFDKGVSYIFDRDGNFVNSFAKQGTGPGEVDRYLNCFTAGDNVVVGTPSKLLFFTKEGKFQKSFANNLFERFPLIFMNANEFLYNPRIVSDSKETKDNIVRTNLTTGVETVFDEFKMAMGEKMPQGGMSLVVLGLTPQIKIGYDPDSQRFYFGRSDDYSIHVTERNGKRIFSFGLDRAKKRVSDEDKRKHFENSRIPKDRIKGIIPTLPDELTYFMRIQVVDGLIFVYPTESLGTRQESLGIDIFSSEGKYLYRSSLQFGDKSPLFTHVEKVVIAGNHLYAILENEAGKNTLAKYKIFLPPSQ